MLQQQKLALANGILTGTATKSVKTLTIEDLKMLFNPQPVKHLPTPANSHGVAVVPGAPGFSGASGNPGWKLNVD